MRRQIKAVTTFPMYLCVYSWEDQQKGMRHLVTALESCNGFFNNLTHVHTDRARERDSFNFENREDCHHLSQVPPVTSARGHLTVETLRSTRCDGSDGEAFLVLRPAFCSVPRPIQDLERSENHTKNCASGKPRAAEKIWFLNQEGRR